MSFAVRPSPALRPFITSISVDLNHALETPRCRERVLPTANVDIVINLRDDELRTYDDSGRVTRASGAILSGPNTRARVIDSDEIGALVCVGFRHGGVSAFVGAACADMADAMIDLDEIFGRNGANLRDRVLEAGSPSAIGAVVNATLLEHLLDEARPDARMAHAAAMLERGASVRDVSSTVGLSTKHLARQFREHVGTTPKRFGRIRRLQRLLTDVHAAADTDWAAVAAAHGYFDQAHMINDFRDLTGLTPTAYAAGTTAEPNHVAFLQSTSTAGS